MCIFVRIYNIPRSFKTLSLYFSPHLNLQMSVIILIAGFFSFRMCISVWVFTYTFYTFFITLFDFQGVNQYEHLESLILNNYSCSRLSFLYNNSQTNWIHISSIPNMGAKDFHDVPVNSDEPIKVILNKNPPLKMFSSRSFSPALKSIKWQESAKGLFMKEYNMNLTAFNQCLL